jgi:hypothetical protein
LGLGVTLVSCSSILGDFSIGDGGPADAIGGKDAAKDVTRDAHPEDRGSDVRHPDAADTGAPVDSGPEAATYTIGGSVVGELAGLVLQDNGGDDLAVSGTSFTFKTPLADGAKYTVTVQKQPGQSCMVTKGTGTVMHADVTTVGVACTAQHLYVGDDNAAGGINRYGLPLKSTTPLDFTIVSPSNVGMALDSNGNLMAADNTGNLAFFMAPLSGTSTKSFTFKNGTSTNDGQIAFLNGGTALYAANVIADVNVFDAPYSSSSVTVRSIASGWSGAIGLVFDAMSNMYVGNNSGTGGSNIYVLSPPYFATPLVTPTITTVEYRKMAINGSTLFVGSIAGTGQVDVYALPLTTTSAPMFSITQGISTPETVAFDADGNLYVGNAGDTSITVYSPPFSAASAPTTTFVVSMSVFAIFGIAIGP